MPGKKICFDTDLIANQEAKQRQEDFSFEADIYGANKFVPDDVTGNHIIGTVQ